MYFLKSQKLKNTFNTFGLNISQVRKLGIMEHGQKLNPHFVTFSMSCTKATMKRYKIVVTKNHAGRYKFNKFANN